MRYLTPAKVGLLVLIQLYCEQAVPHDAIRPVLSFITSHLLDRDRGPAPDQPAARWGKPDEIGSLARYICTDATSFMTGTDILMDGGWVAQ